MSKMLTSFLLYSVVKPMITEAIKSSTSKPEQSHSEQSQPEESKLIQKDGNVLLDGDAIFWEGVGTYTFREKTSKETERGWFPMTDDSGLHVAQGKTLLVLFTNSKRELDYKLYKNS